MAGSGKKRKTLGRGMGDLIGNDLESLVRPQPPDETKPTPALRPDPPKEKQAQERPAVRTSRPAKPSPPAGARERAAAATPPAAPRSGDASTKPGAAPPAKEAPRATAPPASEMPRQESGAVRPIRTRPTPPTETVGAGAHHPRIFAVASGKGGTGKSLVAVNLAVAMAEHRKVCLVDADFGLGNAHILMGLLPRYNVAHLVRRERTLDEVLMEGPRGVMLLPGASGVPEMASLDDGTMDSLASTIGPVLDRCDAVVLDCPGGLTRQSLLMLHGSDVVVVVTNDELTSMTDAYALIKTLVTHRPDLTVGLLVNDALTPTEGAETYRKICHVARKFLGRELLSLGTVPRDAQFERSVMERRPVVVGHPRSAAARAVEELASRLLALRGLDTSTGFPERMHRTVTATGSGNTGDGLCMS